MATPTLNATGSGTNTTTVTVPTGVAVGDMMILRTAGGVPSTPAGWTLLASQSANSPAIAAFSKRAVSGDPGSTITLSAAPNTYQIESWTGVGSDPIVISTVTSTAWTTSPQTFTAPTVTTVDANCVVTEMWTVRGNPGIATTATVIQTPTHGTGAATSLVAGYQTQATAGTSATETATFTGSPLANCNSVTIALAPLQPPLAPTLTAPANATYEDLSGTTTFAWTYNPSTGDGAQNAVEFRRKISGAGSYSYWNPGSSTFQSSPVFFSQVTGSLTFASGVWANGNIYNWSIATQEATQSLQGPFASDFTVTGQAPPTVVITAPTGTIASTAPTVTGTATVASGASITAYRVVVYTAAQVAAGGFNPGVTVGVYDSGVVSTSSLSISQPTSGLSNNVTYYAYVQITETGGETGNWVSQAFTVSFDAPQVPAVTATPGTDGTTGAPIITVAVTGHDNILSTVDASFEGGTLGTWTAGANTTAAASTAAADDGSYSMALTATATGSVTASTASNVYVVQASTAYTISAAFKAATTGRSSTVAVNWYTSAGALISTATSSAVNSITTGWTQAVETVTSPANAAFAAVTVTVAGCSASEVHYVDEVDIGPGTLTTWTRGGLVGSTTFDVWARTAAASTVADAQRPNPAGIRVAAALTPSTAQLASWVDRAAASGVAYEYQAVVNGGAGITTPSAWTA